MELLAIGVNHTTADVELRERLAFAGERMGSALQSLAALPEVKEAALLSTCNRMELYCLCEDGLDLTRWLSDWHQVPVEQVRQALYVHRAQAAVRHMMRVASGLDSQVLGEPQILGQMHDAYRRGQEAKTLGHHLDRVFQHVFSVAKKVRTDTAIGENPVSVASGAVSFARHIFTDFESSRVLLMGAGEMIALVARHLSQQHVKSITIANRTPARAADLAAEVGAQVIPLSAMVDGLTNADIVITCTGSPLPLITLAQVETALKRRRRQPIFMVDIAVPRDVETAVGQLQDVYLYTLDHLHQVIDENLAERQKAAAAGQKMIDVALEAWQQKRRESQAVDTLKAYRQQVDQLSRDVYQRAVKLLDKGQDPADVLERFRHDMVNKMLHHPSVTLRQLAADQRLDELALASELLLDDTPKNTGDKKA